MTNFPENIQILNVLDGDFKFHHLLLTRLISNFSDKKIGKNEIISFFGKNNGLGKIVADKVEHLDRSYFSVYCLLFFGVNEFTIAKIRENYKTIEEIKSDTNFNLDKSIHDDVVAKIETAIDFLIKGCKSPLREQILNIIIDKQPIQNNELKELIFNDNPNLDSQYLDSFLNKLIEEKTIFLSVDGYKMQLISIEKYLEHKTSRYEVILKQKLNGKTLQQIADIENVSRQRIEQIIISTISKLPKFADEDKAKSILSIYSLDDSDLEFIGISKMLSAYVKVKYSCNPRKSIIDFLSDFNLSNSENGLSILTKHNIPVVYGKIFDFDFFSIFNEYCEHNSIYNFEFKKLAPIFNEFLQTLNVKTDKLQINESNLPSLIRKLDSSDLFINVDHDRFIRIVIDELNSDFLESLKEYLESLQGYGSILHFFENNRVMCLENHVQDELELFALAKTLFEQEFKERIEFIRNPCLMKKGINKEQFLENLILDLSLPCTVDDYLNYVHEVTGLNQTTVYANFQKMISKYKNKDGLISLDDDLSSEDESILKELLENKECIGFNYFKNLIDIKHLNPLFLNYNVLRKFGYTKTDVCIFKSEFGSKMNAVKEILEKSAPFLSENELNKIANVEYFYYRYSEIAQESYCLKIGNSNYLNLVARKQCDIVKQLKEDLLDICVDEKFYTLDNFMNQSTYDELLNRNESYKELLYSFNSREILKNVISTEKRFNYINTRNSFIFSESELSLKIIITRIMEENSILMLTELHEILYNEYGIDNVFRNNNLADMGFYCPPSSEKIYLNIEYFNLEMEEILNENS
ncbi:MAG: hypothetical protein MJ211_13975 [Bacteroidales bacterium]|nr:hypothetical protein [Bacteroidales bacterium]